MIAAHSSTVWAIAVFLAALAIYAPTAPTSGPINQDVYSAAIDGVSEVYSVTGQIDLIALVRVPAHDDVAEVVADRLNKVPGVLSTETHIAFRAYSKHDLEAAFSLGLE